MAIVDSVWEHSELLLVAASLVVRAVNTSRASGVIVVVIKNSLPPAIVDECQSVTWREYVALTFSKIDV